MSRHSVISERRCLFARVCHACGFVSTNNQYHLLPHQKNLFSPSRFHLRHSSPSITDKPIITDTTASFDVSLSQYVKTNTGSTYQPFTATAFHSTKNKHLLNRTAIYNSGSRIKIEGAVELYNEHIYCELQNSSFVIPKNSTPSNDNITTVSPSPSRRATIVRSIAGNSLPTKKARSIDASIPLQNTTSSGTDSSNYVQNEDTNLGDQVSNDTQAATIEPNKKPKSNKNTSRSRRVTNLTK